MVITLLTDFGLSDPYVGIMKGVILGICPNVRLVDITHHVPSHDINAAAFILNSAFRYFSEGSIHCVVVDPGVGSERRIIIVQGGGYVFVAPDNGVLKMIYDVFAECSVYQVTRTEFFLPHPSHTFHGRDIFVPVAAYLAKGIKPDRLGVPYDQYIRGEIRHPVNHGNRIIGEIVYIDKFGNAVTNIHRSMLKEDLPVELITGNHRIRGLESSYAGVEIGEPLAIIGSFDYLEIAVREGNAGNLLGLRTEDKIEVQQGIKVNKK